jgi:hypothetical protein
MGGVSWCGGHCGESQEQPSSASAMTALRKVNQSGHLRPTMCPPHFNRPSDLRVVRTIRSVALKQPPSESLEQAASICFDPPITGN